MMYGRPPIVGSVRVLLEHTVQEEGDQPSYSLRVIECRKDKYHCVIEEEGAPAMSIQGEQSLEEAKTAFCRAVILGNAKQIVIDSFEAAFNEAVDDEGYAHKDETD